MAVERRKEDHVALVDKLPFCERVIGKLQLAACVVIGFRQLNDHAHLAIKRGRFEPVQIFVPSIAARVVCVVLGELNFVEASYIETESIRIGLECQLLDTVIEPAQGRVGTAEPSNSGASQMVVHY